MLQKFTNKIFVLLLKCRAGTLPFRHTQFAKKLDERRAKL